MKKKILGFMLLLVLPLSNINVQATSLKIAPEHIGVNKVTENRVERVIATMEPGYSLGLLARDYSIVHNYPKTNQVLLKVPEDMTRDEMIWKLRQREGIKEAHADQDAELHYTPSDPFYATYQYNMRNIGMPSVWDTTFGQLSVVVAIIDTGVSPFSEINTRLTNGADFTNTYVREDTYPGQYSYDGSFHGTAIASLISAQHNSLGIAGMAPNVTLMPIKVFPDGQETTSLSLVAEGIIWAVDHGADILNLSLGGDDTQIELKSAIEYANTNDVLVVAASGNDSYTNKVSYPAAYDEVIAVGAANSSNLVSSFSNKGLPLDIVAPGESIPMYHTTYAAYYLFDGTSFSAPTVAAALALMKSAYPNYSNELIIRLLYSGAEENGTWGKDTNYGYGNLNVQQMFDFADDLDLLDGDDTIATAKSIELNQLYTHSLKLIDDVDVYSFNLSQNETVTINADGQIGTNLSIRVIDGLGNEIAYINDTSYGEAEVYHSLLSAGTYYVSVKDVIGVRSYEDYSIRVSTFDIDPPILRLYSQDTEIFSGSISYFPVTVSIDDFSSVINHAKKDGIDYPWPENNTFYEIGSYNLSSIDLQNNQSDIEFTIKSPYIVTLSFDSQGGTQIEPLVINYGDVPSKPANPTLDSHVFVGWYTSMYLTTPFDFSKPLNKDTIVYAKWLLPIGQVFDISAVSASYSSIKVRWSPTDSVSGYQVYRGFSDTGTFALIATTSSLEYTNLSLTTNRRFFYKVRAFYEVDGFKIYGNFSSIVDAKPIPAASTSIEVKPVNSNTLSIIWQPVEGSDGYQLFRSFGPTGTFKLAATTVDASYTNSMLTLNRSYFYRVRAFKMVGTTRVVGPYSSIAGAKPIPAGPASVSAFSGGFDRINLSWTSASGASGYTIYRSTSASGTFSIVGNTTSTSFQNIGLKSGTTYYYKVRSYYLVNGIKNYGLMSGIVYETTPRSS